MAGLDGKNLKWAVTKAHTGDVPTIIDRNLGEFLRSLFCVVFTLEQYRLQRHLESEYLTSIHWQLVPTPLQDVDVVKYAFLGT